MRKTLLVIVALLGLSIPAKAQSITNAQAVWSAVKYQTTCSSTTVGLSAVEMTGNTSTHTTTGGISWIKITNANQFASVCCSSSTNVTCNTGALGDGDEIAKRTAITAQPNSLSWSISTMQQWFCIATLASTGVTVCKIR